MPEEKSIEELNKMTIDELYEELGRLLPTDKDAKGIIDKAKYGRRWLSNQVDRIKAVICADDAWPKLRKKYDTTDVPKVIVAIVEHWLQQLYGDNIPILTLAFIFCKEGLDRVCGISND